MKAILWNDNPNMSELYFFGSDITIRTRNGIRSVFRTESQTVLDIIRTSSHNTQVVEISDNIFNYASSYLQHCETALLTLKDLDTSMKSELHDLTDLNDGWLTRASLELHTNPNWYCKK